MTIQAVEYFVFSKIFLSLVLTTASVSSIYSADHSAVETLDSQLTPEITTQIAKEMADKPDGFKIHVNGWAVRKVKDPTVVHVDLMNEILAKIDKNLTDFKYPESGDYTILVHQPVEGHNYYRVINFSVNIEAAKPEDIIKNVNAQLLVEINMQDMAVVVEDVHQEPRVEATAEHVHEEPRVDATAGHVHDVAAVLERVHMEEERAHQPAVVAEDVHEEPRVHATVEHLHDVAAVPERVHMEEEHAHQSVVVAEHVHEEPRVDATAGHVHEEPHAHMEEHLHNVAHGQAVSGLAAPSSSSLSLLDHVGNLFSADRVHSEEHAHS